ncbi:unnamed protein product [Rhizophagus irregularis]|nr:unnamed protein product [Rhizophagus irregularis]
MIGKILQEFMDLLVEEINGIWYLNGLNMIVHRDIRAENILITLNETAKQANFNLVVNYSRIAASLKQSQKLERVRYCASEQRGLIIQI